MGTVRYTVVDGEVLAEKRSGVRRQYVPDPLGSTVALLDNSQAKTDTFQYWPYGEEAARTGTTPTPFRFVGTLGYYRDNAARSYVRTRYLDTKTARWMSEDVLGFGGGVDFYVYGDNNPSSRVDPLGLDAVPVQPIPFRPVMPNDPRFPEPQPPYGNRLGNNMYFWCNLDEDCVRRMGQRAINEVWRYFAPSPVGGGWIDGPLGFSVPRPADNGPANAFLHCMWACLTKKACGANSYDIGVIGHEGNRFPGGTFHPGSGMDIANDREGAGCAAHASQCNSCCLNKLRKGDLFMLPPTMWEPGSLLMRPLPRTY